MVQAALQSDSNPEDASNVSEGQNHARHQQSKRLFAALSGGLSEEQRSLTSASYIKLARWLGRSHDPFIRFNYVFTNAVLVQGFSDDEDEGVNDVFNDEERQIFTEIYELICKLIPGFSALIRKFKMHPEMLIRLANVMTRALGNARSDDCGSLRDDGLSYVALLMEDKVLQPPITARSSKAETRGFRHPVLGRLLCPIKYLGDFDGDTETFLQKLEDRRISVTAKDFPLFLYENDSYDPAEMDKGLCCGPLLVRTWRHIFTSPSSATKTTPCPGKTRAGQSKLNNLNEVTPRTIAYAALQTRWHLCAEDDWHLEDGQFIKSEFFSAILWLFQDDPEDDWCIDTLKWWNEQVFTPASVKEHNIAAQGASNDLVDILTQRRRRRQERELAADPCRDSGQQSTSLNALAMSLDIVGNAPLPGIKLVTQLLLDIIRRVQDTQQNAEAFSALAEDVEWLLFLACKVKAGNDKELECYVDALKRMLEDLQNQLPSSTDAIRAFFNSNSYRQHIIALNNALQRTIDKFQLALHITTHDQVNHLKAELSDLRKRGSQKGGLVKQDLNAHNLTAKGNIRAVPKAMDVEQKIHHATWVSDQDVTIEITGGVT